jgi:hypothetical protein
MVLLHDPGFADVLYYCHDGEYQFELTFTSTNQTEKPAKPIIQVWVSNRYLKHHPYPYPSNPYLHTHMGLQTHDMN